MEAASEANLYMMFERRQLEAGRPRPVLPVTIITGFLGAGKTTLLRNILRSKKNLRIAAAVNEYGTADHDGGVVERDGLTDKVDKLTGGCVCCEMSLGSELEEKVAELLRKPDHAEDRYDYLVIETSGVSDPESLIQALDKKFGKLTRARLDSVIGVVDADFLFHKLEGESPVLVSLRRQLENADVVLLNKADLLGAEQKKGPLLAATNMFPFDDTTFVEMPFDQLGSGQLYGDAEWTPRLPYPASGHKNSSTPSPNSRYWSTFSRTTGVDHTRARRISTPSSRTCHLSELSSRVSAVNPLARVVTCSYGRVPLHTVLDVEAPRADIQGVSHERVQTQLHVSSLGGNLRKASASNGHPSQASGDSSWNKDCRATESSAASSTEQFRGHLREDGLEQITFTAGAPLSLARFQDWVSCEMPAGAIRAKGVLAFDEDRLTRSVFNMSGRRRLSFEEDGRWEGPLRLHLVIIGVGMDESEVLTTLEGMCVTTSTPRKSPSFPTARSPEQACAGSVETLGGHVGPNGDDGVTAELRRLEGLLEADPHFDLVGSDANPSCPPHVARFRFTGRGVYGLPPSQLSLKFGVNLNAINRAILRAVNDGTAARTSDRLQGAGNDPGIASPNSAGADGHRATPRVFMSSQERVCASRSTGDEDCVVLRYAVGGRVSLADAWPGVVRETRAVMARELAHVHFCNCFS